MSDFQKAISVLRSAGFEVTVKYVGFVQVASIKGEEFYGTLSSTKLAKKIIEDTTGIKS